MTTQMVDCAVNLLIVISIATKTIRVSRSRVYRIVFENKNVYNFLNYITSTKLPKVFANTWNLPLQI